MQLDPDNKSDNEEDDIQISFKQWTTTDRTELVARCESDWLELLVSKLDKITTHSYIAKSQAAFLKKPSWNLQIQKLLY